MYKLYASRRNNTVKQRDTIRNKEAFVKHEKTPTTTRFEGVLNISYMLMFLKKTTFGHFGLSFEPITKSL